MTGRVNLFLGLRRHLSLSTKPFNKNDIRVSFRSLNKLYIKVQKDICPYTSKSNVVYRISCGDCDASYVGQTSRRLKTRIAEYRNHIRYNTSVITEHRRQLDHEVPMGRSRDFERGALLPETFGFRDAQYQEAEEWSEFTD